MFVLDTNVVSELRKPPGRIDGNVAAWATRLAPGALFLSAITLLELEIGVLQMARRDPVQGALLRRWFDDHLQPAFSGRILPIDAQVALRCARLHVPDRRSERDATIAATALVHGMTLVTRNVQDFEMTGAALLDPWSWKIASAPSP
jgi:hypothetical protein